MFHKKAESRNLPLSNNLKSTKPNNFLTSKKNTFIQRIQNPKTNSTQNDHQAATDLKIITIHTNTGSPAAAQSRGGAAPGQGAPGPGTCAPRGPWPRFPAGCCTRPGRIWSGGPTPPGGPDAPLVSVLGHSNYRAGAGCGFAGLLVDGC